MQFVETNRQPPQNRFDIILKKWIKYKNTVEINKTIADLTSNDFIAGYGNKAALK